MVTRRNSHPEEKISKELGVVNANRQFHQWGKAGTWLDKQLHAVERKANGKKECGVEKDPSRYAEIQGTNHLVDGREGERT